MTTQHTLTPWRAEHAVRTARTGMKEWQVISGTQVVASMVGTSAAEANAEFIVRACNAHDELVAALATLLREHNCQRYPLASDWETARAALAKVSK